MMDVALLPRWVYELYFPTTYLDLMVTQVHATCFKIYVPYFRCHICFGEWGRGGCHDLWYWLVCMWKCMPKCAYVCVCVCVCVCVYTQKHTHISSCNNTPSANTRNDVTMLSKYFPMADMIVVQQLKIFCTKWHAISYTAKSWVTLQVYHDKLASFWQQAMHNKVTCRKQTTISKASQVAAWW